MEQNANSVEHPFSCYLYLGHLDSILAGSNQMPFTAWAKEERNRYRDRKTYSQWLQEVW